MSVPANATAPRFSRALIFTTLSIPAALFARPAGGSKIRAIERFDPDDGKDVATSRAGRRSNRQCPEVPF